MSAIWHRSGADETADLVRYVQSCAAANVARRALLVRMSLLPPDLARPHHLRLAREALDPLRSDGRTRLFVLPNGDQIIIWRGDDASPIGRVATELTVLFSDAEPPLDVASMIVSLALPEQGDILLRAARESLIAPRPNLSTTMAPRLPLDMASLAKLEASLLRADVASFVRRRRVVARRDDGGFAPRWEKRFVSVSDLAAALAPDRAIRADPWLFRRLTRSLDRRMLALLVDPAELRDAGPLSLNLNVESILAPEFLRFDAALPAGLRGRVVLELLAKDIVGDMAAFVFARDFARARGYHLLLRGMTADQLPVFPRERLGFDLVELVWNADLAAAPADLLGDDAINVVLAKADGAEALAWGAARRIRLYQRS
jgi:hypothetical protein